MKRELFCAAITLSLLIAGCSSWSGSSAGRTAFMPSRLPSYSGPRARVAVAEFEVHAAKMDESAAAGLRRMFIAALTNSGRFVVVEGQQKDPARPPSVAVGVSLLEFEPQASGGTAGVGGGGGIGSGLMGGLLGTQLNKAHISMEVRIVDPVGSGVISTQRVQGQAADMAAGTRTAGGIFGGLRLDPGLAGYANTPMEKAIRICITEATRYVSQDIPENSYKY